MLSGETAGGDFPLESLTIMHRIVEEAESAIDYQGIYLRIRAATLARQTRMSVAEGHAATAVEHASDADARLIVVITESGNTVRLIAKYRPQAVILAVTSRPVVARQLLSLRGVLSVVVDLGSAEEMFQKGVEYALSLNLRSVTSGSSALFVAEQRAGQHGAGFSDK